MVLIYDLYEAYNLILLLASIVESADITVEVRPTKHLELIQCRLTPIY